jgi:tetratricopeptide (TPR) repeat protein
LRLSPTFLAHPGAIGCAAFFSSFGLDTAMRRYDDGFLRAMALAAFLLGGAAGAGAAEDGAWTDCKSDNVDRRIAGCTRLLEPGALESGAEQARAYFNRGVALANTGDHDRAIADFSRAIQLDPKPARAFYDRGVAYAAKNDLDRSVADWDAALRLDPSLAAAHYNLGAIAANKGDFAEAIAHFDAAIRLDPGRVPAYFNRGVAYANKGDLDRAIADWSEAIRLDAKSAPAYHNRGAGYEAKGELDAALADFKRLLELAPGNADGAAGVARLEKKIAAAKTAPSAAK